jgi:hypothetical protein
LLRRRAVRRAAASRVTGRPDLIYGPHRHLASRLRRDLRTLPLGDTGYANATNNKGERLIWLPHEALAKLNHARGPDESYSDVILRIAAEGVT